MCPYHLQCRCLNLQCVSLPIIQQRGVHNGLGSGDLRVWKKAIGLVTVGRISQERHLFGGPSLDLTYPGVKVGCHR